MRVTTIQCDLKWESPAVNRRNLEQKMQGLKGGTDLILLPEMFTTGFTMNPTDLAESMEYVHNLEYTVSPMSTRTDMRMNRFVHKWSFSAVKEFEEMILEEWDNTSVHNLRFGVFVIFPERNHSIGIKLIETIER